ncbi:MAG: division/cell wall cluster transcriptional repressor MraZ [Chloroflexi bacterium AL-W]|nr:division/cell wall cluster transcriptional repressor MraZ [Chloroflexi bacterium AL-N1]NOK65196.1 division/cell wall cluster transcriptional repressor MraZ [Chloroflexi bacterium AL-N10]NOK72538.1 division/cell wall cluster transcriptional repressor MraZ [Chloroflexi bacterium AL-N5]NOK79375.1 division/cell wall cluster transcriptional repressor MraZ [Chloroflexi bacterium AL-W]NOK87291.1 division/cell wall cluster transcriptional repressor MraZ [Chloroflexi bacterium AL-N15]
MFLGEYEHSLDDKGRLAVPARFREILGERVFITRGFDRCLMGFTHDKWEQLAQQVSELAIGQTQARNLRRLLFASAAETTLDRQGRILVPQTLREYAGLAEQVVIAGLNTYFEIWSGNRWNAVMEEIDEQGSELAEQLAALGM